VSSALVVFAKAPVPGQVKTRLIPVLGAAGAATLAQRMLEHTLLQSGALPVSRWELCVSPDPDHPAFASAVADSGGRLHLTLQGEGDLGERMHRALARVLDECLRNRASLLSPVHRKVLLMGTDAPGLTTAVLRQAVEALDGNDAVFVPALDGGYALVGLTRGAPELFLGMTWSTPRVMAETRERARRAGLRWTELAPVADIDEPRDLIHLPEGWP
jgi:rSAM/selenodomain-associated transferase 1